MTPLQRRTKHITTTRRPVSRAERPAEEHDEEPGVREQLQEAVRAAVRPLLTGRNADAVDAVVDAINEALRGRFVVGIRRPRPRLETERALSMRLPDVGVEIAYPRKGKHYLVRIVSEHEAELVVDGGTKRFSSLKSVAREILGYPPSVGGWQFFFGRASREEVAERYGKSKKA